MILVMMMMMIIIITIIIIIKKTIIIITRLQTGVHCWDGTRYLMGQATDTYKMFHKVQAIYSL